MHRNAFLPHLSASCALRRAAFPLFLLASCASPLSVAPGATEAQVRARLGPPDAVYHLAGPQETDRFEYDTAPMGRRTYLVDFDSSGRAIAARQARTRDHFKRIQIGVDTTDSVLREFGRPTRIVPSHLSGHVIWEYPYFEDGVWNSLMCVTFDAGKVVRHADNLQDPAYFVNR